MGPMRVLSDFLLMQETEGEMQESELARWARRQRSRIQWGLKDGEEWSGREDLNLRPPGPEPGALPDCATPRTLLPGATHDAKCHKPWAIRHDLWPSGCRCVGCNPWAERRTGPQCQHKQFSRDSARGVRTLPFRSLTQWAARARAGFEPPSQRRDVGHPAASTVCPHINHTHFVDLGDIKGIRYISPNQLFEISKLINK